MRPRLPRLAGWRGVVRYMAVSLFDADVRNRLMNVLMRVRIIFMTPPQHLQRIAGRGCGGGSATRLSSCTSGVDVFVARHLFLQIIAPHFDLDICFGSRHDAGMKILFLQLR